MQLTGPFPLALGSTTVVPVPSVQGAGQKFHAVLLTNQSPWTLSAVALGTGYTKWISPGNEELVPLDPQTTEIDLTPLAATTGLGVGSPQVLASWVDAQSPALVGSVWPVATGVAAAVTAGLAPWQTVYSPTLTGSGSATGYLDVSAASALTVTATQNGSAVAAKLLFTWTEVNSGVAPVIYTDYAYLSAGAVGTATTFILPVRGPFLTVQIVGGGGLSVAFTITPSRSTTGAAFGIMAAGLAIPGPIFGVTSQTVNSLTTLTVAPTFDYFGPVTFYAFASIAGVTLQIQDLDQTGTVVNTEAFMASVNQAVGGGQTYQVANGRFWLSRYLHKLMLVNNNTTTNATVHAMVTAEA